jgi:23S rRNA (cytosine1962-C5)-methyltransferase
MRRSRPWLLVVLIGAVVGVVFAGVSTYDFVQHLDRQVHNLHCSFIPGVSHSGESGCQIAMMSPYSSVLRSRIWGGVPIALPALSVFAFLVFYALDLALTRRKADPRATGFLALATVLPALASLVMLLISLTQLGTTCKLCVCIYVASALCLVGGVALWRQAVRERGGEPAPGRRGAHDEPAFIGRARAGSDARLVAVGSGGASAGFLAAAFLIGVGFVAVPVMLYLAMAPDHARFIGSCEGLAHPEDPYGVMLRVERSETGGGDPDGSAGGAGGRGPPPLRGIERGPGDDAWLDAAVAAVTSALPPGDVFVKRRERFAHRGADQQYERQADQGAWRTVHEGGHAFRVNLSDYVDTGLFLDHRITRAKVAAEPARTMLNLFGYTGAFSVYAAAAGMQTTTVDLSNTYLGWAGENLALNRLTGELVHADVREFLVDARRAGRRWDLVVVDPPTFSNSKRMDYTWDIQRDHAALLADVLAVTDRVVWFSTNAKRFKLELDHPGLVDETHATTPPDFKHKPHRAWRIEMAPETRKHENTKQR